MIAMPCTVNVIEFDGLSASLRTIDVVPFAE